MSGIFLLHYYFKYQSKRILCSGSCVCNSLSATCVLTWGVRNQSPALPSWPCLHPWAHHFTCLHFLMKDTLQEQHAAFGFRTNDSDFRSNKYWTCNHNVQDFFQAPTSHLSWTPSRDREKTLDKPGSCWQVCLCRGVSVLFQFQIACHYFSTRPSSGKKNFAPYIVKTMVF